MGKAIFRVIAIRKIIYPDKISLLKSAFDQRFFIFLTSFTIIEFMNIIRISKLLLLLLLISACSNKGFTKRKYMAGHFLAFKKEASTPKKLVNRNFFPQKAQATSIKIAAEKSSLKECQIKNEVVHTFPQTKNHEIIVTAKREERLEKRRNKLLIKNKNDFVNRHKKSEGFKAYLVSFLPAVFLIPGFFYYFVLSLASGSGFAPISAGLLLLLILSSLLAIYFALKSFAIARDALNAKENLISKYFAFRAVIASIGLIICSVLFIILSFYLLLF